MSIKARSLSHPEAVRQIGQMAAQLAAKSQDTGDSKRDSL